VEISDNLISDDILGGNILLEGMAGGDIMIGEDQPLTIEAGE